MKILTILLSLVVFVVKGQSNEASRYATFKLKEIALLNIEPSNTSVILNLESPKLPGEKMTTKAVNNTKWINFTSSLTNKSSSRNISIKIEDGEIPPGILLKIKTDSYQGNGKGKLGSNSNIITLSKKSQTIVSDIGGAYTGHGLYNGYKLTYLLDIDNYKLLNMDNSETLTISLTLTDF
ncbi:hypothetical protein [Lutibacter citreus]|uniref:hypothetical protein n=1 Tax=Lutibacter citreus TaxID=2138210 RepID=UPI000DBE9C5E|nr:hypothetical protein [Lutibacter citreus]